MTDLEVILIFTIWIITVSVVFFYTFEIYLPKKRQAKKSYEEYTEQQLKRICKKLELDYPDLARESNTEESLSYLGLKEDEENREISRKYFKETVNTNFKKWLKDNQFTQGGKIKEGMNPNDEKIGVLKGGEVWVTKKAYDKYTKEQLKMINKVNP